MKRKRRLRVDNEFWGTSLATIEKTDSTIKKSYSGNIYRGFEKLKNEKHWYEKFPDQLKKQFPYIVPNIEKFSKNGEQINLELNLLERLSFTKAILKGEIQDKTAEILFSNVIKLLLEYIYPSRSSSVEHEVIYQQFHLDRFHLADHYLSKNKKFYELVQCKELIVNDINCPNPLTIFNLLNQYSGNYFFNSRLVNFHGNLHLDNILIDIFNKPTLNSITFIDPRGELLGPPHYDFAKLLITLEAYYDEINYKGSKAIYHFNSNRVIINIEIDDSKNYLYSKLLNIFATQLTEFAKAEKISANKFLKSVMACEWFHVYSFMFYHSIKEPKDMNKLVSYLSILALLGKRLYDYNSTTHDFSKRLNIK